jgi:hypothetical protein
MIVGECFIFHVTARQVSAQAIDEKLPNDKRCFTLHVGCSERDSNDRPISKKLPM